MALPGVPSQVAAEAPAWRFDGTSSVFNGLLDSRLRARRRLIDWRHYTEVFGAGESAVRIILLLTGFILIPL